MCVYIAKENLSKLMLIDVEGNHAKIRSRRKSRLTQGFNILKVNDDILYILTIKITEKEESHKIYMVKSSKEELSALSTTLNGYSEEALKKVIGKELPEPIAEADTLDYLVLYFADLPGKCDIAVKRVKELENNIYIKVYPLIQKKRDVNGNEYYPYGKGNFRDIIELAIKAGETIEPKGRR